MNELMSNLKRMKTDSENVEELEQESGERCLAPTREWSENLDPVLAQGLQALYFIMAGAGVPAHVILTIAAIKFADKMKKIDAEKWVLSRSNWNEMDKTGAIDVLKTLDAPGDDPLGVINRLADPKGEPSPKNPDDDINMN
jgi:hypothetical protein